AVDDLLEPGGPADAVLDEPGRADPGDARKSRVRAGREARDDHQHGGGDDLPDQRAHRGGTGVDAVRDPSRHDVGERVRPGTVTAHFPASEPSADSAESAAPDDSGAPDAS